MEIACGGAHGCCKGERHVTPVSPANARKGHLTIGRLSQERCDGMIKGYNGRVAKAERRRFRFTNYDPGDAFILFVVITLGSWAVHRGRGPAAFIVLLAVVGV